MGDFIPDNGHQCIDCKTGDTGIRPRKIVTAEGRPKRCATHETARLRGARKQARARQIERTYDISAEDAYELLLLQGGRCWLCQKATGATKSLAVDHDHATGEVRGRLCGPCNQFIGRLGDDPAAAQRLVGYLTADTPYRRLRAAQTLMSSGRAGSAEVVVLTVLEHGGELYAGWRYDGPVEGIIYQTLVRRADGAWSTERETSEPIVQATECSTCHAAPGQPHTEYCFGASIVGG